MDFEKLTKLLESVEVAGNSGEPSTEGKLSAMSDLSIYLNSFSTKQISEYGDSVPFVMLFNCLQAMEGENGNDRCW